MTEPANIISRSIMCVQRFMREVIGRTAILPLRESG